MKIGKIDNLGRVVIPIEYRKSLNLPCNSKIIVTEYSSSVIITAYECACRLCARPIGNEAEIPLCRDCIERIKQQY